MKDARVEKQTFVAFNHLSLQRSLSKYKRTGQFEKIIQDINFSELIENLSEQHSDNDEVNAEDESDAFVGYISEDEEHEAPAQAALEAERRSRSNPEVFCYCRGRETNDMVRCDKCKEWFHYACAGVTEDALDDDEPWFCDPCAPP